VYDRGVQLIQGKVYDCTDRRGDESTVGRIIHCRLLLIHGCITEDIEEMTKKTGNYKKFGVFLEMFVSAMHQVIKIVLRNKRHQRQSLWSYSLDLMSNNFRIIMAYIQPPRTPQGYTSL